MTSIMNLAGCCIIVLEEEQDLTVLLEWRKSGQPRVGRQKFEEARPRVAVVSHVRHVLTQVRLPIKCLGSHRVVRPTSHRPDSELIHAVTGCCSYHFCQFLVRGQFTDSKVNRNPLLRIVQVKPLMTCSIPGTNSNRFISRSLCN